MSLKATIEIAAPPSEVRAKFLDFTAIPSYTKAFESITVTSTPEKPGIELQKGDKVHVKLANSPAFTGVIEHNTAESFAWTGSLPFIFTGTHSFLFTPSQTTPNGTTFTQEEHFSGALAYLLMGDNVVGRSTGVKEKTRKGWEKFNEDLKAVCEKARGAQ